MGSMEYDVEGVTLIRNKKGQHVFFGGWIASDEAEPGFEIIADKDNILKASVTRLSRDEKKLELRGYGREYRYVFQFAARAELKENVKRVSLWHNDIRLSDESIRRLKKAYEKNVLRLNLEEWKKKDNHAIIKGWCFHKYLPFELWAEDKNGKKIDADISFSRRVDIENSFHIDNDEKRDFGFVINIDIERLDSDDVYVVLKADGKEIKEYANLSKKKNIKEFESLKDKLFSADRWKKAFRYIKKGDFKAVANKVSKLSDTLDDTYQRWFLAHKATETELREQSEYIFSLNPKISIVIPLFNTKKPFLKAIIDSVLYQSYANWQLCLADGSTDKSVGEYIKDNYNDKRIIYKKLEKNEGIAGNTNAALSMATGDFVVLSDHDDILELDALYEIVKLYNEDESLDIIYTDEDLTDDTGVKFRSPRFKPDYNPDLLNSINYICHIFAVKKHIMDEVGGFRREYDGAQDWDMILRCCEKANKIGHIPKILYHWRAYEESTAGNTDSKEYAIEAGRKAVSDHMKRIGLNAELEYTDVFVMFRPKLIPKGHPLISIIIPNKDEADTLKCCIESIESKSTYDNYEIVIVENNSTSEEIFDYYKELENKYKNINIVYYKGDFNYSKINNFGAKQAKGDYYILLNNDTEVITTDWMECMLGYCERNDTGIVGAKLYYPDETVQHCGAVIGVGGFAGHIQTLTTPQNAGYLGRLKAAQDLSAVTAACLMIKKEAFDEVGGLDEDFKVALNDMDLCLKVRNTGRLVALDPGVELFHYESKSRGSEMSEEKHERFKSEIKRFRDKWSDIIEKGDPYYNKNLTLMYGDCRIRSEDEHFDIIEEIYG